MPLPFVSSPGLTLGVELELQLVDRATRDLSPSAPAVLERLPGAERIKPEFFRSMVEVTTGVCGNAREARAQLEHEIGRLRAVCDEIGVDLAASGSHPFARHRDRLLFPDERYQSLIDRNRWLARRFQVFGVHVHVGMRDADHAVAMLNGVLSYLPHALGLSASSPYWQGTDTGLASSRVTVYEALPTAGHPCTFEDWEGFEALYDGMLATNAIRSIKDLWWDIRPHADYGTVEVRICDMSPRLTEIIAVVAFVHCVFAWLDSMYREGRRFTPPPYWVLRENKWRALRWGLEAELILVDKHCETRLLRDDVVDLAARLEPFARELRCAAELKAAAAMASGPSSYERQRALFARDGKLESVVEALVREFATDDIVTV